MIALTRAQMRLFQDLRENDQAFVDNIRRGTRDALTNAGLAYETSSGSICLSDDGRRAVICHGRQVIVPKGVSKSVAEIPTTSAALRRSDTEGGAK